MADDRVPNPAAGPMAARPLRIVSPSSAWGGYRLSDVWKHRELLYFLAWRDIKLRYRQTVLGVGWAVLSARGGP
jgi:lipopolysaccharide transport system permease protein